MTRLYLKIAYIFIIFISFFLIGKNTLAENIIDQFDFTSTNYLYWHDNWKVAGQIITPGHNNISAIYVGNFNASTTVSICSGIPNYANQQEVEDYATDCNISGSSLVRKESLIATEAGNRYVFSSPVSVSQGGNYYFVIDMRINAGAGGNNPAYNTGGVGAVLDGPTDLMTTPGLEFATFYNDEYTEPPEEPTFQIELITPSPTQPFDVYYGQPGSFTFNYMNPLNWYPQIRFMVKRLADENSSGWNDYVAGASPFWTSSEATSTLTYGSASFRLPDGTYELRLDFWGNIPAQLGMATTTFSINTGGTYGGYSFSSTSTPLLKPNEFNMETLCDNIETSTGFDDLHIFGDIECGMKRALYASIHWAFVPSFDTLQNFRISYELWRGCFPFNTYFQLTDRLNYVINTTASSTAGTIKIPFIDKEGSFYMLDSVSSSSLSGWVGQENNNLFRTTIGYILWLLAGAVIYFTVKNI